MTEQNTNEQSQSITPGAEAAQPSEVQVQAQEAQQSLTITKEEYGAAQERAAFDLYVKKQGVTIPENFKDAGAWFDSLKESQKQYTQARQEISNLKKQYETQETATNPNYQEPTAETPEVTQTEAPVEQPPSIDELRIPSKEEETKEATSADTQAQRAFSDEDYKTWSLEVATTGTLSEATQTEIQNKAGFTKPMIQDFLAAQKAKAREAFSQASEKVGGKDRLAKIFGWASNNLSQEQQISINEGLASPNYEITLRGLASMYDQAAPAAKVQQAKAQEPIASSNREAVSASANVPQGYTSKREFYADRNNPNYHVDPKFRSAVEQRAQQTDWATLPA
jgi:hypothetical protein